MLDLNKPMKFRNMDCEIISVHKQPDESLLVLIRNNKGVYTTLDRYSDGSYHPRGQFPERDLINVPEIKKVVRWVPELNDKFSGIYYAASQRGGAYQTPITLTFTDNVLTNVEMGEHL